jgi:hypothetical protein
LWFGAQMAIDQPPVRKLSSDKRIGPRSGQSSPRRRPMDTLLKIINDVAHAGESRATTICDALGVFGRHLEMIIDRWDPGKRRYRTETFCYGSRSCSLCGPGPAPLRPVALEPAAAFNYP